MIYEEICTYEVAKLAKEKGFDVPTAKNYRHKNGTTCNAPTQSLLQRWLRDNHEVDVWVDTAATMATKNQRCYYWHIAYESDGRCIYILDSMLSYPTYEKALEEGLKEAIIEFVEEKR